MSTAVAETSANNKPGNEKSDEDLPKIGESKEDSVVSVSSSDSCLPMPITSSTEVQVETETSTSSSEYDNNTNTNTANSSLSIFDLKKEEKIDSGFIPGLDLFSTDSTEINEKESLEMSGMILDKVFPKKHDDVEKQNKSEESNIAAPPPGPDEKQCKENCSTNGNYCVWCFEFQQFKWADILMGN